MWELPYYSNQGETNGILQLLAGAVYYGTDQERLTSVVGSVRHAQIVHFHLDLYRTCKEIFTSVAFCSSFCVSPGLHAKNHMKNG